MVEVPQVAVEQAVKQVQKCAYSDEYIVAQVSSPFSKLYVTETNEVAGVEGRHRFLQFSKGGYQGGMNLSDPTKLVFSYTRAMIEIMNMYRPNSQRVFMIGHGIGTMTSQISTLGKTIEVAELDEKVLEVSHTYFGYKGNVVEIGDGRILLSNKSNHTYDVMLLDAYSGGTVPYHLTTEQFFDLTRHKLTSEGILMMNVVGNTIKDKYVESLYGTVAKVYSYVKVYTADPNLSPLAVQNLIIVASQVKLNSVSLQEGKEAHIRRGKVISESE